MMFEYRIRRVIDFVMFPLFNSFEVVKYEAHLKFKKMPAVYSKLSVTKMY